MIFGRKRKSETDEETTEEKERDESEQMPSPKIVYLNGNKNTPAVLIDDDAGNEENETDNVLIIPLGHAVSVPRNTVSEKEGTPGADDEDE